MPPPAEEFTDLLARVRQGDEAALARLLLDYEPKVRLAARALLGPALRRHLDSVDVAQSVHLALLTGLRGDKFALSGPDKLIALAVSLVRRKVAMHWRRVQREQRRDAARVAQQGPAALLAVARGPGGDPAQMAQLQEEIQLFWQSLDLTERGLIDLRLQGYSTAEAADELGVAANVLRVVLSRLRKRLRERGILTDWL